MRIIFFLTFLIMLIMLTGCSGKWKGGIYQGILRSADGPGRELTLYLLPDQSFIEKTVFLKNPAEPYYDYGKWNITGQEILLIYKDSNISSYRFAGEDLEEKIPDETSPPTDNSLFRIIPIGKY